MHTFHLKSKAFNKRQNPDNRNNVFTYKLHIISIGQFTLKLKITKLLIIQKE